MCTNAPRLIMTDNSQISFKSPCKATYGGTTCKTQTRTTRLRLRSISPQKIEIRMLLTENWKYCKTYEHTLGLPNSCFKNECSYNHLASRNAQHIISVVHFIHPTIPIIRFFTILLQHYYKVRTRNADHIRNGDRLAITRLYYSAGNLVSKCCSYAIKMSHNTSYVVWRA